MPREVVAQAQSHPTAFPGSPPGNSAVHLGTLPRGSAPTSHLLSAAPTKVPFPGNPTYAAHHPGFPPQPEDPQTEGHGPLSPNPCALHSPGRPLLVPWAARILAARAPPQLGSPRRPGRSCPRENGLTFEKRLGLRSEGLRGRASYGALLVLDCPRPSHLLLVPGGAPGVEPGTRCRPQAIWAP